MISMYSDKEKKEVVVKVGNDEVKLNISFLCEVKIKKDGVLHFLIHRAFDENYTSYFLLSAYNKEYKLVKRYLLADYVLLSTMIDLCEDITYKYKKGGSDD